MPEFHDTYMGRQFYGTTMPNLVRQLERIAFTLESISDKPTLSQVEISIQQKSNQKNIPDSD